MKKINFRFLGLFALFICVFSNQVFCAEIVIRKDDGQGGLPNALVTAKTYTVSSKTVIMVTADLIGTDLFVDFNSSVGTAFVSVVDLSGNVVYQTVVDTFSTPEVIIPVDGLSSGKYSLKISYGSTKLFGNFQL